MALFGGSGAGLHIPGTNLNVGNPVRGTVNVAHALPFDPTPGFNIDAHAGGGIPFISRGNGSTGIAPVANTISQPNSKSGVVPASNQNNGGGGMSTINTNPYAGSSYDSLYGTYGSQAHSALNDLLNAKNTADQQLNSQYGIKGNELQGGYNQAQNTYNQDVTQQNQNLLNEQNQVHQGVAHAYQNLLNLLGAYGGGSSSVALNWAPMAATRFEQAQVSGANQNTAQNLHSLATNFGNYQNEFDQQKKQLADQQAQDLANNQSQYDATRGQLNDILQAISSRAIDPNTIGSELSTIRGGIPHTRFVQPSYNGTTPVYAAPSVASFEVATPQSNVTQQLPGNSSTTPALALFLNQQRKQQNANVTPAM